MKRLLALALSFLVLPCAAHAQGSILQGGPFTPGHSPMYVGSGQQGSQAVVQDSGPAGGGAVGLGLSEWLQVNRSASANSGTGPLGTHNCAYSAPVATGNYKYFCWDANAQGGGLIAVGGAGSGSPASLTFMINGVPYVFPTAVVANIPIGPANFYVNAGTGNDLNNCEAATTTTGLNGPCRTLARAISAVHATDANSANPQINLTAGTYTSSALISGPMRGGGNSQFVSGITISGAGSNLTILDNVDANCWTVLVSSGGSVILEKLTIKKSSGSCGALYVQNSAYAATSTDIAFGATPGGEQMHIEAGGIVEHTAPYRITGNFLRHWGISTGGGAEIDGYAVTCDGVTAFTEFARVSSNGWLLFLNGTSFVGCGAVTGNKFGVDSNGTITDFTGVGPSLLPGSTPGLLETGGMYIPPPAPAINSCTNGAVAASSTDFAMQVVFSGALSGICSLTFGNPKAQPPICVGSNTTGTAMAVSSNTTTVSMQGSFSNTESVYVVCTGKPN